MDDVNGSEKEGETKEEVDFVVVQEGDEKHDKDVEKVARFFLKASKS